MYTLVGIAVGGGLGSVARYLVAGWVQRGFGLGFPLGTLTVNVTGAFLIGLLFFLFTERLMVAPEVRTAILVGGLGGYTTFSTFSLETLNLLQEGAVALALFNAVGSVVLCLLATWLGMYLARAV